MRLNPEYVDRLETKVGRLEDELAESEARIKELLDINEALCESVSELKKGLLWISTTLSNSL